MVKKLCMSCWKRPATKAKKDKTGKIKHYCDVCDQSRSAAIAKSKEVKQHAKQI
jgi:hypothetical protein